MGDRTKGGLERLEKKTYCVEIFSIRNHIRKVSSGWKNTYI